MLPDGDQGWRSEPHKPLRSIASLATIPDFEIRLFPVIPALLLDSLHARAVYHLWSWLLYSELVWNSASSPAAGV